MHFFINALAQYTILAMVVRSFKYRNAPTIGGLALSKRNICEISHKKLCNKLNMIEKASNQVIETVRLSLLNDCISAFICLKGLKTSSFYVMTQYFQQISSAQNILP